MTPHAAAAGAYPHPRRLSGGGVALVVVLHLAASWLLLRMNAVGMPAPAAVLSVQLIEPAVRPPAPATPVVPPKAKPAARRPASTAQPALAAVPTAAAPTAAIAAPPAGAVAPAAAAVPAPPSAPRFDADYLDNPKPVYPELSRRLGEEGKVVLRVHVRADGGAGDIHVHAASNSSRLDQAALEAVRRWRFVPARQGEAAVAAWVLVPIAFTLKE